jgi:catechol 2,3-dioxygenase
MLEGEKLENGIPGHASALAPGVADLTLVVRNLQSEIDFYRELGFIVRKIYSLEGSEIAELGTELNSILKLVEDKEATHPGMNMAGLYHFAILVPDRKSLGEAYLRIGGKGIIFDGFADHGVSEALYLSDPEGNGIEIYSDRPKELWFKESKERIRMTTEPLDIDSLLKETRDYNVHNDTFPKSTKLGHIHLKVTNLQKSIRFYTEVLGLEIKQVIPSAAFVSYSGYHHHIGMNTWESLGGISRKKGFTGLERFTLVADSSVKANMQKNGNDGTMSYLDPDGIEVNVVLPQ